jgi:hypothetical protein
MTANNTNHLNATAISLLNDTNESKIDYIQRDFWIGYPYARQILGELDSLQAHPKCARMPCRAIVGNPSNGKTTILRHWMKRKRTIERDDGSIAIQAVLIETPPSPTERRLYSSILNALGIVHRERGAEDALLKQLKDRLTTFNVQNLIFDEFHNVLNGPIAGQLRFLTALKSLLNATSLPVVVAGTPDVTRALATDRQFVSRFEKLELGPWGANAETLSLISTLESLLPFPQPSNLANRQNVTKILSVSDGSIGSIVKPIKRAAVQAIEKKQDYISESVLEETIVRLSRQLV